MMTVFAFFGFICGVFIMLSITAAVVLVAADTLGRFNIGGSSNSVTQKIVTLVFIFLVVAAWYLLLSNAPFDIVISTK